MPAFHEPVTEAEIAYADEDPPIPPVPQPPNAGAASMKIDKIDSTRAEILVTVNFDNPNIFDIPSPTINYNYHINRNLFIRGLIESDGYLAASSTTPIVFRMLVFYTDLYRSNRPLRNSPLAEVPSLLVMTCDFDNTNPDWENFTFEISGTLPLR